LDIQAKAEESIFVIHIYRNSDEICCGSYHGMQLLSAAYLVINVNSITKIIILVGIASVDFDIGL
jgi:hypothetical protein